MEVSPRFLTFLMKNWSVYGRLWIFTEVFGWFWMKFARNFVEIRIFEIETTQKPRWKSINVHKSSNTTSEARKQRLWDFTGVFASFSYEISLFSCSCENAEVFHMFSNNFQPNFGWNYGTDAPRTEIDLHSASVISHGLLWHFRFFMFIGKQCSFWSVCEQFLTDFRCKLGQRCVSQANLPPYCIGALTRCCSSKCNEPRVYAKTPVLSACFTT